MKHFALALLLILISLPKHAYAEETLRFTQAKTKKEEHAITLWKEKNNSDFEHLISRADLNDDFIHEYVIKPQQCTSKTFCAYGIVGLKENRPIILGRFDAHKIMISSKKTYGVRNIIVYNQPHNDFKSTIAVWDPFIFSYKLQ